jgi:outer membrane protein
MNRYIVLFGITFIQVLFTYAQETPVSKLTFKEAVTIGLDKNLNLNQQRNLLVSSRVAKTAGLAGLGPSINVNGNTGRNDGNSFNQQQGRVVNGVQDFTNASIEATLPLFRGLNGINSYRQASSLYESQLHVVNRAQQDVIRDVARQYLTCLLDQKLVGIREKNLETQQQQLNQINELVNAGSRAGVDKKNQEYQVKNAELMLLRAKNTLRNDKVLLAQTIQLDPTKQFELEEPGWDIKSLENISLEELYNVASEKRSDLEQVRQNEKTSQYGFMATKGSYFPMVNAFASYGSAYNYIHPSATNPDPTNRSVDTQLRKDNTQLTYGISFRIPIYNAFSNRSNAVRAKMQFENSKLETENTQLKIRSEVLLAHQNFLDAKAAFEAATAQLEAAESSNILEQERYVLGISDIVAITQSNQAYTTAQADLESARYTLMFQHLLINYAVGTLNADDIP